MIKNLLLLVVLLNVGVYLSAQTIELSGYVLDKDTGEKLIGSTVYNRSINQGAATNAHGFFQLEASVNDQLVISYVGYYGDTLLMSEIYQGCILQVELVPNASIDEIVISATDERINKNVGILHLTPKVVSKVNGFMGEPDVLKAYQLMPGVQNGVEGFSGMYVRGGGSDQNLILLDDVPIYNATHLFGMFSIFNNSIINNSTMVKGGGEAQYGGRLSSILDIRMKEGNANKVSGDLSISNIAASFHINGPVANKFRYSLAVRRTFFDAFSMPIQKASHSDYTKYYDQVYFYDMNAKLSYAFNQKHKLSLSGYLGKDKFERVREKNDSIKLTDNSTIGWGNVLFSGKYSASFAHKTHMNATLAYGNYKFENSGEYQMKTEIVDEQRSSSMFSGVANTVGKVDFENYYWPAHDIRWGASVINYRFQPEAFSASNNDSLMLDTTLNDYKILANEIGVYVQDGLDIGDKMRVNAGLRLSGFYTDGQFSHTWEPRLSTKYVFSKFVSAQASYYRTAQYIFLLSNANVGLPTDLWLPMTNRQKPQSANQWELGLNVSLFKQFRFSVEAFYKTMDGLMEFKDGEEATANGNDWDLKTEQGSGVAKGLEFLLSKNSGKTTGWIAYTLSGSDRTFTTINSGKSYPYKYSKTHDLSIVLQQVLSAKLKLNLTWVYSSGLRVTLPEQRYPQGGPRLPFDNGMETGFSSEQFHFYQYGERNGEQLPAYHRLDVSFQFQFKIPSKHTWQVGVYNAYNQLNAYYYYMQGNNLYQTSLFGLLPFISYAYEF